MLWRKLSGTTLTMQCSSNYMEPNPEAAETRYSPAKCLGTHLNIVEGFPDKKHISTSYVERQNLTMRMGDAEVYPSD